jgi:hypothetical protein
VLVTGGVGVVVSSLLVRLGARFVTVPNLMCLSLDSCVVPRTLHADRKRSPNGEEHCEQQQKPEAEGLHGDQVSTGGKVQSSLRGRRGRAIWQL